MHGKREFLPDADPQPAYHGTVGHVPRPQDLEKIVQKYFL